MKAKLQWAWPSRTRSARGRSAFGRQAGFWVLIELIVVAVIIAFAMSYYLKGAQDVAATQQLLDTETGARTLPGAALEQAKGVTCQNNLHGLRTATVIYQGQYGVFPPDLQTLQAGASLTCPVGGEPYAYDLNTGQVKCVYPQHEAD